MRVARRVPIRRRPKKPAPYIVDTVTRAASTTSMGTTDTGQAYTSETGAVGGVSAAGALYMVSGPTTGGLFSLPYALPDVDITATFVRPASGFTGIAGRVNGTASRIFGGVDAAASLLVISTSEGGTGTTRASVALPTTDIVVSDPMTLRLLIVGTAVSVFLNGSSTPALTYTLTGTQVTGIIGTNIALRQSIAGAGNGSFEDIRVFDPNGSSPTITNPGDPNAITAPPSGDEPGWTQTNRVGFDTTAARGTVAANYPTLATMQNVRGTNGTAYYRDSTGYVDPGTSELVVDIGWYDGSDGGLVEHRGFYLLPGKWLSEANQRCDFRMRMPEVLAGWKAILIGYSNTNVWAEGEIDPFETGNIGGSFKMYTHVIGLPQANAYANESIKYPGTNTLVSMTNYTTISGRWTPTEISVLVDGQKAASTTNPAGIPTSPMSWRIGFEWSSLNAAVPPPTQGRARIFIDWVTTHSMNFDTMPQSAVVPQRPLTVTAGAFKAGGTTIRLSGANFYDAITSDAGASPGNLEATPGSVRRATLGELQEIGANAVRAHTLFIGYGKTGTQMPTLGNYDEAVLVRCDQFLAECRMRNLYVMAPLTDSWNFYHGGSITFANMVLGGTRTDTQARIEFCTNPTVLAAFKSYVSTLMNRVNTVTGVAWKDDPTLAIIETANEAWQTDSFLTTTNAATGNTVWHAHMAAWLKTNFPGKLVADGYACSGSGATNRSYAIGNPAFDILGTHLYDDMRNNSTFVNAQANAARAAGQAYVVGEWDWRDVANGGPTIQNSGVTRQQFLTALDDNVAANGQFWWTPRVTGRNSNGAYQLYLDTPANADQTSAKAQLTTFARSYKFTRPDYTVTPTVRRSL